MNASTFFMWRTVTSPKANGDEGARFAWQAKPLSRESWSKNPVRLQPEPEALAVLAERRVEPAELLHALEPVGDRVPVHEQRAGGGAGGAVVLEERLQRGHEVRAVGLVVAHKRRHGVLVEGAHLVRVGGEDAEQQPVGARSEVLPDRHLAAAHDVEHQLGLTQRAAEVARLAVEARHPDESRP